MLEKDSKYHYYGIMKTTIDIPEKELQDALKFSGEKTKRGAIVAAVADYNRRQRMAALARHLGTCKDLMTVEELAALRKRG
jgi:hypothetical protein